MAPLGTAVFECFDPLRIGWSCAFESPLAVHVAQKLDEVLPLLREAERAAQEGLWAALMLSYEAAPAFDSVMEVHPPGDFPVGWLALFREPSAQTPSFRSGGLLKPDWNPLIPRSEYAAAIAAIRAAITRGDCYQVNYTFPLECRFEGDAWAYYRALGAAQGAGYSAWLDLGRYRLLSFSPELFFERQGSVLRARPMKGTARRGRWAAEDQAQRKQLEGSAKNRAENLMIVDLLRNDLGRVSVPGTVCVPRLFEVERYETLFQMTSTIESVCRPESRLVDLFRALFPCGSVTGAPKISAMKMIHSLERYPRNVYTGTIGFVRPGGDCTFSVAIRTLVLDTKAGRAVFGVGGGITCDSTAEDEYAECLTKARFLTEPPPTFQLLETLRLEEGAYFLSDRHSDRMRESAAFFDFIWDEAAVRAALEAIRAAHPQGVWKVRLLASRVGELQSEAARLIPETKQVWRVALAPGPLDSGSRFLYHKTTHRSFYEQPVRTRPDCDDLIFWNERGEVTESSIANVVVETGEERWTPPRNSGLLAGTFREELLAQGMIRERVISKEELNRADRLFLINSVRRWMPARLIHR
ncbi:MAG: aminodeoxychorismate synthase component I [Acidobacteria bacterium]|nr:aminodeoxychorismate synthase component I [Acidobacteriota bacterium]MCI0721699.1 aminodeoxychorismate synthase component I [Acidobacteriota bacterium]